MCLKTVVCSRPRVPQPLNLLHSPAQPRLFLGCVQYCCWIIFELMKAIISFITVSSSYEQFGIHVLGKWLTGRRS